jgi:sugar lactone lactonase YvrE
LAQKSGLGNRGYNLVISDYVANSIRVYDGNTGSFLRDFTTGSQLNSPIGFTFDRFGNIYVGWNGCKYGPLLCSAFDLDKDRVQVFDSHGIFIKDFVTSAKSGGLRGPDTLAFGPDGNLYVSSFWTNEIKRYNGSTGAFLGNFVDANSGLESPSDIAFGPDGNLYVSSYLTGVIKRYDGANGSPMGDFITGLSNPMFMAFGPIDHNLYIGSDYSGIVKRYNGSTGEFLGNFTDTDGNPAMLLFK